MSTPYVSVAMGKKLMEKYPDQFKGSAVSAFRLLEILVDEGLAVQTESVRRGAGHRRWWSSEAMWRPNTVHAKVFYSKWNPNLAEALAEVLESYMDHMKALERETGA